MCGEEVYSTEFYADVWCYNNNCFWAGVVKYYCKVSLTSAIFSSIPSCYPYCFNSFNLHSTWTSYSIFIILFPSPSSYFSSSSSESIQLSSSESKSLEYSSSYPTSCSYSSLSFFIPSQLLPLSLETVSFPSLISVQSFHSSFVYFRS